MNDYKNSPEGRRVAEKYKDIINLQRPHSSRPRMDGVQRAKIFSPYDALNGFEEEIADVNREKREVKRIDLSDEAKAVLSDKLLQVQKGMTVSVRYFVAGKDKNTGNYVLLTGVVNRIDPVFRTLEIMQEDRHADDTGKIEKSLPTVIKFDNLTDISSSEIKDTDEYPGKE